MANFTEYTTIEGDRWDTIAWKAYGDASLYLTIAAANRTIPLNAVLEAGTKIMVPVLEEVELDVNLLPPWKR